ncbi:hypothetical protein BH11PAT1_BH11PAT1_3350 [soil metagenome]
MKRSFSVKTSGLTLVEVLISTAIIVGFLTTLMTVHNAYLNSSFSNLQSVKATYLGEEGIESIKGLRDASWTTNIKNLSNGTPYYLSFVSGAWTTTTTPSLIDSKFTRVIVFSSVNRDATNDITTTGGTLDLNAREVQVTVSWLDHEATSTRVLDTYITNIFTN